MEGGDGDSNGHVKIEMENLSKKNAQPFQEISKLVRKTKEDYKDIASHLTNIQNILERNAECIFTSHTKGRNILHVLAGQPERNAEILTVFGFGIEGESDTFQKYVSEKSVQKLLNMPIETKNRYPIHTAVENGFVEFVTKMLQLCPSLISVQDSDGNTPLHIAVQSSMPEAVECMRSIFEIMEENNLSEDILRNKKTVAGLTPIHLLCKKVPKNASARVVTKLLLLLSYDCCSQIVNSTDTCNKSPLHFLCSKDDQHAGADQMKNVHDLVKTLISKLKDGDGLNQSTNDEFKRTALHLATISEFPRIVKLLVDQDETDLMRKDTHGKMAIHYAAQQALRPKSKNSVHILADWTLVKKNFAAMTPEPQDLFRDYLLWNAYKEQNGTSSTALTLACQSKSTKTVDFLLKNLYHAKENFGIWFMGKDNEGQDVYSLKQVYKYTPGALEFLFDKSIRIDVENSNEIRVVFVTNLSVITALARPIQEDKSVSEMEYLGYAKDWPEDIQEKLLLHPMTHCALHALWKNMLPYKVLWLLMNVIWLVSYWNLVPFNFIVEKGLYPLNQVVAAWVLAAMSVLYSVNELFVLKTYVKRLLSAESTVVMTLIQIVLTFGAVNGPCLQSIGVLEHTSPPNNLEVFCAAGGILLSFILFWRNLGIIYLPLGTHVEYLIQTLKKILQSLGCTIAIILGFERAFRQILPQHFPSANIWAFTKTLVMMTGEFEYTEMYHSAENGTIPNPDGFGEWLDDFETWNLVLFILFLIILPVTFYNLVTGVVVDKIRNMESKLEMYQIRNHIRLVNYVQRTIMSKICCSCLKIFQPCYTSYRVGSDGKVMFDQEIKWFIEKDVKPKSFSIFCHTWWKSENTHNELCGNFLAKKVKTKFFEMYEAKINESEAAVESSIDYI